MNNDLDRTLQAITTHSWRVVLLERGQKRPVAGVPWQITSDLNTVRAHLASGCGVGLVCGESRIAVLDFDDMAAYQEMAARLGPIKPWSTSPSGGVHCYFKAADGLPAKIHWNGQTVGEVQRGTRQHVVMAPSPYPGKPAKGVPPGGYYAWLVDPRGDLPELPAAWVEHMLIVPDYVKADDIRGHEADGSDWRGESKEELVKRALEQDGAKLRRNGVHFQCLGCKRLGRDRSMDNAIVFLETGKFTCTVFREAHRSAIAEQLRLGLCDDPWENAPLAENAPGYLDPDGAPLAEDAPGYIDPMDVPLCENVPGHRDPMSYPLEEDVEVTPGRTRRTRRSAALRVKQ
jgi:hypothetical protein